MPEHTSIHRSPAPVRTFGTLAAFAAVSVLAACSGSSSGGGPSSVASTTAPPAVTTTTTTAATPPVATTTAVAGPSTSASASPAAPTSRGSGSGGSAGPATCRESQLRAQIDARPTVGPVPANDKAVIVQFINTSSTSCTIHGYPGAAILDASNHPVVQATRTIRGEVLGLPTGVSTLPTVTLKPGAVAAAGIEGVNTRKAGTAQAGCNVTYPRIVVTPPNTRTAVPFTVTWPACYTFTVHPTNIDKTAN